MVYATLGLCSGIALWRTTQPKWHPAATIPPSLTSPISSFHVFSTHRIHPVYPPSLYTYIRFHSSKYSIFHDNYCHTIFVPRLVLYYTLVRRAWTQNFLDLHFPPYNYWHFRLNYKRALESILKFVIIL